MKSATQAREHDLSSQDLLTLVRYEADEGGEYLVADRAVDSYAATSELLKVFDANPGDAIRLLHAWAMLFVVEFGINEFGEDARAVFDAVWLASRTGEATDVELARASYLQFTSKQRSVTRDLCLVNNLFNAGNVLSEAEPRAEFALDTLRALTNIAALVNPRDAKTAERLAADALVAVVQEFTC